MKSDIPPTRNSDDRLWITILSILTRLLFPEADHIFLEYREVDDMTIEIFYFYLVEYKSWNGKFNSGQVEKKVTKERVVASEKSQECSCPIRWPIRKKLIV